MAAHLCQQVALSVLLFSAPSLGRRLQRLHSAGAHNSSSIQAGWGPAPAPAPEDSAAGGPGGAPANASASPGPAPEDPCTCNFNDFCTCGGTLKYLECVSQKCMREGCKCEKNQFSHACGRMASVCKETLDVTCSAEEAKCDGKYHQGTDGIIGLTIDYDKLESRAYCGPFGKCTGEVNVAVAIHKPAAGVRLDCAMETHDTFEKAGEQMVLLTKRARLGGRLAANTSKKLEGCGEKVTGPEAHCTMPMPKFIKSGKSIEGLCRLVEDETGRILTKDAWFKITNPTEEYQEPNATVVTPTKVKVTKGDKEPAAKGGAAPWASALALALPAAAAAW